MKEANKFHYSYSSKPNDEVQAIREKYILREENKMDRLKKLDAGVKRPAATVAYILGSVSAIVMGCGMSLVMTDLGTWLGMSKTMVPGVCIGVIGLVMAVVNYPLYKGILASRRKKYAEEIIALSNEVMNG